MFCLLPPYPQRIGNTINVVKETRNQCDLQNASIVEASVTQSIHIGSPNRYGILGNFLDVSKHRVVTIIKLCRAPVAFEGIREVLV